VTKLLSQPHRPVPASQHRGEPSGSLGSRSPGELPPAGLGHRTQGKYRQESGK